MKRSNLSLTHAGACRMAPSVPLARISFVYWPVLAAQVAGQDRIEAHHQHMHASLKVMAAQDEQWMRVMQTMREYENGVEPPIMSRRVGANTMATIDDLTYCALAMRT